MHMLNANDFDLALSFSSGQPLGFYADYRVGKGKEFLSYVTSKGIFRLQCYGSGARKKIDYEFEGGYSEMEARKEVRKRLGLDDDLKSVYKAISTDAFMKEAVSALRGLRITQNEPWETTLCFVVSQVNNMKRIRFTIKNIIERFGAYDAGIGARLFPTPHDVAKASLADLRRCGTGFRASYIKSAATAFAEGFDADAVHGMNYRSAKTEFMRLDGVGDKVADCILLFAYKKLDAFPIDVWIKRTLEHVYFSGHRKGIMALHEFAERRWDGYAGYAQQYIFQHARANKIAKKEVQLKRMFS